MMLSCLLSSSVGPVVNKLTASAWRCVVVEVERRTNRHYSGTAASVDLSGVFPPITTPFNKDESIAFDKLATNFQHWETVPFQGQFINPSAAARRLA
jgi:hypothetical protein